MSDKSNSNGADKVLSELSSIAFSNVADYLYIDKEDGTLKVTEDAIADRNVMAAVAELKNTRQGIEVKLYSKMKALELLGKYYGILNGSKGADTEDMEEIYAQVFDDE